MLDDPASLSCFSFVPAALCGQQLTFATYQGGSGEETASGVALDSAGNVFLAGTTSSADFPAATTVGSFAVFLVSCRSTPTCGGRTKSISAAMSRWY
jgi:hypothetical protein